MDVTFPVVLPVVIDSAEKLLVLLQSFLGYKPLNWNFKIPKTLMIVTNLIREPLCIDIIYDDITEPVDLCHQGLTQKIWIPTKEFRKTSEGRLARSAKRKHNRFSSRQSSVAGINVVDNLGEQSNNESWDDDCIVAVVKHENLDTRDLSTALNEAWLKLVLTRALKNVCSSTA
ncbi:unnamed protein product [Allacma fusca]|uniref:Uncharacterized protein n=1 Tax=Allacma fusca TaxID=39272 RepID=A0A8J2P777_9HEXA|nr:unnamed protein product [Allacma fusca]